MREFKRSASRHTIEIQFTTFQAIFTAVLVASVLIGVAFLVVMWNSDRKH